MCAKADFSILVICYYTIVLQWAIMLMCVKANFSMLVICYYTIVLQWLFYNNK
jgi:hypothetical protein